MTDSIDERDATSDEAYELGKTAGYDEGWDECAKGIIAWLRLNDVAAPMWEWSGAYADYVQRMFADASKYGEVDRP